MKPVVRSAVFGIIVSFLSCYLIYWLTHNYKTVLLIAACNALLTYQMVRDVKKIYEEDPPKQDQKTKMCDVCNSQHGSAK